MYAAVLGDFEAGDAVICILGCRTEIQRITCVEDPGSASLRKIRGGKACRRASAARIRWHHTDLDIRVRYGRLKVQLLVIGCARQHTALRIGFLLKALDPVHEILIHDDGVEMCRRTLLHRLHRILRKIDGVTVHTLSSHAVEVAEIILRIAGGDLLILIICRDGDRITGDGTEIAIYTIDRAFIQGEDDVRIVCIDICKDIPAVGFSRFDDLRAALHLYLHRHGVGRSEEAHLLRIRHTDLILFIHRRDTIEAHIALRRLGLRSIHCIDDGLDIIGDVLYLDRCTARKLRGIKFTIPVLLLEVLSGTQRMQLEAELIASAVAADLLPVWNQILIVESVDGRPTGRRMFVRAPYGAGTPGGRMEVFQLALALMEVRLSPRKQIAVLERAEPVRLASVALILSIGKDTADVGAGGEEILSDLQCRLIAFIVDVRYDIALFILYLVGFSTDRDVEGKIVGTICDCAVGSIGLLVLI